VNTAAEGTAPAAEAVAAGSVGGPDGSVPTGPAARRRGGKVLRWLPWAALLVALAVALAIGTTRPAAHLTTQQRVQHITSQLRCPVCEGETVADSSATISQDIRALVQQRIQAGQSDSQILTYVVHHYPGTLLKPPASGVGLIVWVLPVIALLAGAGGLFFAFRRWHARPGVTVSDADRRLVDEALGR
jgi:cytochrome c-type biogenesis protein CcmH